MSFTPRCEYVCGLISRRLKLLVEQAANVTGFETDHAVAWQAGFSISGRGRQSLKKSNPG
jgi:hypothetical protein